MLRSRRKSRVDQWESRSLENTGPAARDAISAMDQAIARNAGAAGIAYQPGRTFSAQKLPDSARPIVRSGKRLFGTDVHFVGAEGLDWTLQFD